MGIDESVGAGTNDGTVPGWGGVEFGRRLGLKAVVGTALIGGVAALVDASASAAGTKSDTIKIGYVSPTTGHLADYARPDQFVLSLIRRAGHYAGGVTLGRTKYRIEIVRRDSKSDPAVATTAAIELIQVSGVDLIVTSSGPETTIPVSVVCEGAGVPCLSTVCPWEMWWSGFIGNSIGPAGNAVGSSPQYCTTFFFGVREYVNCFLPMWNKMLAATDASPVYAGMFPNDADGNAFRADWPSTLATVVSAEGAAPWTFVDGGSYGDDSSDYSAMIDGFKVGAGAKPCDFFIGYPLPEDFTAFWKQSEQRGWRPKLATVARAMQFPQDAYALGGLAANVASECWFAPNAPYESSLTEMTAKSLAADYQRATGQQWVQTLGSTYALFEIAIEALKKVRNPHDRLAVANALKNVDYVGVCGRLNFSTASNPAKGVSIIKPVGIQWKPGSKELVGARRFAWSPWVVDNTLNRHIPLQAPLEPTNT
jgi:branched-chain amino acid transport system substrate-binding protein